MGIFRKLSMWWNRDALEHAEEETRMTPIERDVAEEDYEARKDDAFVASTFAGGEAKEAADEELADD